MKKFILLCLVISFFIVNNANCNDDRDLIASSYDWGKKRIDLPGFPSGPYESDSIAKVILLKNSSTMPITIYNLKIISDINGTAFEFDRNTLKNIQIQPKDSLYVQVRFHPKVSGHHELIIEYDNTAGSRTQTILRGIGTVPKIKTEDVDFGSTILQDYAQPNLRKVRFTNPDASEWNFGDTVTITDFKVLPVGNEISTDTSWGIEGFRFNKLALNFPIKLAQGEFIEFDAEFVADKVPLASASLVSACNADTEAVSFWTGTGIAEGVRVTADQAQTCFNSSGILKCKVYNTGSSGLNIESLVIQPLDNQSVGVFDFVNPADANSFQLSAGAYKEIEVRYSTVWSSYPIPDTIIYRANLLAYNSSLFTPVAVSETPIIVFTVHRYLNTKLILSKHKVCIDDTLETKIVLDSGYDVGSAGISYLNFELKYNTEYLKLNTDDIKLIGLLENTYTIDSLKINDDNGEIKFKLLSKNGIFNFPYGGELISLKFNTYKFVENGVISHFNYSITKDYCNGCLEFTSGSDSLMYECNNIKNEIRKIYPNPIFQNKFNMEFTLSSKGITLVRIYNLLGQQISNEASYELNSGFHTITIDVSNLPIGAYWCDLISGSLHETKMFIVK